jgi:hypothetical protein
MRRKDRPRIREWILTNGLRPHIERGVWDGFTVQDDGTGRLRDWLRSQGFSSGTGPECRPVLMGTLEKQMRRLVVEGHWGPVTLPMRVRRRARQERGWA